VREENQRRREREREAGSQKLCLFSNLLFVKVFLKIDFQK
jgi:hypothetical protein